MSSSTNIIKTILNKEENVRDIKILFHNLIDICFLDIYPYFYICCFLYIFQLVINIVLVVYIMRYKLFLVSSK